MDPKPYHLSISPKTRFLNLFRKFFIYTGTDQLLAPCTRKFGNDSLAAKLVPPNYLYPSGTFRNCNINGINYRLDVSDTNGHITYFSLEEASQSELFSHVHPGMTVIDIGANIGAFTLQFANKVKETGKIFSFEPSPINYKYAQKNISLNRFNNIKLINEGLGNEKSTAFLSNVNPHNRGMLRILNEENNYEKEEVHIDTLDNSMEKFSIPKPDFIKIDVEGFEYKVLEGASNTLSRYHPVLFIELDDRNLREQGNNAKELVVLLQKSGYNIINAANHEKINDTSDFTNCHFDILCTNN